MSEFSETVTSYLTVRAIDPAVAWSVGVRERNGTLIWPTVDADGEPSPRWRRLGDTRGPKTRGAAGRTLGVWWPKGLPDLAHGPGGLGDVLVCEGESDALAAVCALGSYPVAVASIPGASFPGARLVAQLHAAGASVAALAFDGDMAGALNADRIAEALVAEGIGARILPISPGEDLASTLGALAPGERRRWLAHALVQARPVGLEVAALVAENRWLRASWAQAVRTTTNRSEAA